MAKGALNVMTLNLAKQLGPRGITVNSLAPGWITGQCLDTMARSTAMGLRALVRRGLSAQGGTDERFRIVWN